MMNAENALEHIKTCLHEEKDFIPIQAVFYPTKSAGGYAHGMFHRDKILEEQVKKWLNSHSNFADLMRRYVVYDASLIDRAWPKHYPVRFVNMEGLLADGNNVFIFFPDTLRISGAHKPDNYFGFEFIDAWVSIFDEVVFPCVRRIFDLESQKFLFSVLRPRLESTIYLTSIFHEIGHRVGYWKVSPQKDERLAINTFHTDVLGELATDTLAVNHLPEFPEVLIFVFLQRIFWFGRADYLQRTSSGRIQQDNDSWVGSFLWENYLNHRALSLNAEGRWVFHYDKVLVAFKTVLKNIDQLGEQVVQYPLTEQDLFIQKWMERQVNLDREGQFLMPEGLNSLYQQCVGVPEKPSPKFTSSSLSENIH